MAPNRGIPTGRDVNMYVQMENNTFIGRLLRWSRSGSPRTRGPHTPALTTTFTVKLSELIPRLPCDVILYAVLAVRHCIIVNAMSMLGGPCNLTGLI